MKLRIFLYLVILAFISSNALAAKNNKNSNSTGATTTQKNEEAAVNPVDLILEDHKHIRNEFASLTKEIDNLKTDNGNHDKNNKNNNNKNEMKAVKDHFKKIKDFIVKHETMEEKVFYPELEKTNSFKDTIKMLIAEEKAAGKTIKEIDGTKDDNQWKEKVKAFMKDVDKHANDEETKLLPEVGKTVDKAKLDEIGKKMKKFRTNNKMEY